MHVQGHLAAMIGNRTLIDTAPQYFGRIMQDASSLRVATRLAKFEVRLILAMLETSPQGSVMYEILKTQRLNDS